MTAQFWKVLVTVAVFIPATLLPIINPLVGAPIFSSMTRGSERLARTMAERVAINCFFLLAGALLIGGYVLELFGLSIPIVRVGGGLVVASTGWRLLNDFDQDQVQRSVADSLGEMSTAEIARRSFLPMSFPLTVGPGSIAAAITLGSKRPEQPADLLPGVTGGFIGLMIVTLVIYLAYRYSTPLLNRLGETGAIVLTRLAAFILLCIGVDILWSGLSELIRLG
jgi:multiple antibiotic resistance protein